MFLSKTKLIRQECRLIKKEKKNKKRTKRSQPSEYRSQSRPSSQDLNPAQGSASKHLSKTIQSAFHNRYHLMKSQNRLLPPRQPKLTLTQGRNSKIGLCRQVQISVSGSRSRSNHSASKECQTEHNQISRPPSLSKNIQYPYNSIHFQSKPAANPTNKDIKQFIDRQLRPANPFPYMPHTDSKQMFEQLDDLEIPMLNVVQAKPPPAQVPKKPIKQETNRCQPKKSTNQFVLKQSHYDDDDLQQIKFEDKKSKPPADNPYKPTFKEQPLQKEVKKEVGKAVPPKNQADKPRNDQDSRIELKQQKKITKKQAKESQSKQVGDDSIWLLVRKKVQTLNDLVTHIVEHREYLDKNYPKWIGASLQIYRKFIYYRQQTVALLSGKSMGDFERFFFKRVQARQLSRTVEKHTNQIKSLQQQNKKILKVQDKLRDMCKRQKNFQQLVSLASADIDFEHLYELVFDQVNDLSTKSDEILIAFLCKRLDSILVLYYLQKRIPYELKDRQRLKSNPKEYLRLRVQELNNLQS